MFWIMTIETAVQIVKKRYGYITTYVDLRGRMMRVIRAETELKEIPEVKFPEGGISLFASEIIELAHGDVTIKDLVERKNPEIFHLNPAASELGRKGGKTMAKRGPDYFRRLQALRKTKAGGRPPKA